MSKFDDPMIALTRKYGRKLRAQNPDYMQNLQQNVKYDWYRLKNSAVKAGEYDLYIYDEIMPQWMADLFGSGVSAEGLIAELNEVDASVINVRINSPGGAVFEAIAIYNALVNHDAEIKVYVDALAASAASIIAMAGDSITMMVGGQLMIHDAMGVAMGNAAEVRDYAKFLDGQSDNLASIYAARNGSEVKEMRALMLAETWMTAAEAVEMGLADEVYKKPKMADPKEEELEEEEPEEEDPSEEDPAEEDPEEEGDDKEKEDEEGEDGDTDNVAARMARTHTLRNRGFKYPGRGAAPEPTPANVDSMVAVLQNFFGGK